MRVALNATCLLSPLTGIGHYTRQLALGLSAREDIDPLLFLGGRWSQSVPEPTRTAASIGRLAAVGRWIPGAYAVRRLLQASRFTAQARRRGVEVYHEPNILPLPFDGPTVLTVHDLSWIRHPESHPDERVRTMDRHFEPGLRRSQVVLTDSEFVRHEIIQEFGFPADRIRAIPLGVEALFSPRSAEQTRPVLETLGLIHGQYLLAVGTLEPRKNLSTALKAYRALPASLRARHPMVVIGMRGWKTSGLEQELAPLVDAGEVRQLGYLPREELALITAGALALVYPSLYEGFGLPPLEAMSCGVPSVTSNTSSLPEVVGDSALTMAPQDIDTLNRHLQDLLTLPELRQTLSVRALARSRQFSWTRCVEETVSAYQLALAPARPADTLPDRRSPSLTR
ncbi:glycosyltransferase family 4 protein [Ramlibacter aurantiacus]|nr:glycosyltransferase family 1 protein [Ramlibacter aurantiacus]